jgi:prephenate dehydrogenase
MKLKNIGIVGVGLLGGSFALRISTLFPEVHVVGFDNNEAHLEEAQERGIIHEYRIHGDYHNLDMIIVAIPVDHTCSLLSHILDNVHEGCIVLDVGSTKYLICESVRNHPRRGQFIATHPIAGTEFTGPSAAFAELLNNKIQIICEREKTHPGLLQIAVDLFERLGMRLRFMDPLDHDYHLAFVSHLSHISSFMLARTVMDEEQNERNIFDMAGSGFASTVRLAKSSPAMWTPIFQQNKENLIRAIDVYTQHLIHFRNLLERDDYTAIFEIMDSTNDIKRILEQIPNPK